MVEQDLYQQRPSKDETFQQDVEAALALVKSRPQERVGDFPGLVDLQELWGMQNTKANSQLWEEQSGQMVGFAIVDPTYSQLIFEVQHNAQYTKIGSEMITWGQKTLSKTGANAVRTNCTDDNHARIALLTQHGFVAESLVNQHFERSLAEPIPEPQLPSGFTIHHVRGEADVERNVQLHRVAFGTQNMTTDYRLSMMRVPEYDSTLDLIIVAPDGQWVAFCMGSISAEENRQTGQQMGWLDPVGTHPDYRQKGLAKALLLTGLARLKERGMAFAGTNSATSNVAMSHAAESVGFKVKSRSTWYRKMIG